MGQGQEDKSHDVIANMEARLAKVKNSGGVGLD